MVSDSKAQGIGRNACCNANNKTIIVGQDMRGQWGVEDVENVRPMQNRAEDVKPAWKRNRWWERKVKRWNQ